MDRLAVHGAGFVGYLIVEDERSSCKVKRRIDGNSSAMPVLSLSAAVFLLSTTAPSEYPVTRAQRFVPSAW